MAEFRLDELAIVVVARNHNPTILNPDFLRRNGIVPDDWQVAGSPLCADPVAQVEFASGVTVAAQFDRLVFTERDVGKLPNAARVPSIAAKYLKTLPHVTYTAVGINPQASIAFLEQDRARSFIVDRLVCSSIWDGLSDGPMGASVSLVFPLGERLLTVSVQAVPLEGGKGSTAQVRGNFHYEPVDHDHDARNARIVAILGRWQAEVSFFEEQIVKRLLKEAD